jgi:hypothetical protein
MSEQEFDLVVMGGGLIFEDGRAVGVRFADASKRGQTVRARFIVDASGGAGLLANRIGERVYDSVGAVIPVSNVKEGGLVPSADRLHWAACE